ncbi:MAG TPA: hypothetical protein VNC50_02870, partial [Planctomycetia bacterium]|nr:hypothetical protein [Planctomycetia bacterium]
GNPGGGATSRGQGGGDVFRGQGQDDYRGGVAVGRRGGVAVGPNGGVAVGPRGNAAYYPGGGQGGRWGTYHAPYNNLYHHGNYIRGGWGYYNAFYDNWWWQRPGLWFGVGWLAGQAWSTPNWGYVSSYAGYPAEPIYYDYGSNVVYNGDNVLIDGQPVPASQYEAAATQIADAGRSTDPGTNEGFQPLGVFALTRGEETQSDKVFQLAVNKEGVIRGNYYDAFTDTTLPVYGSVDRTTQKAAWSVGDRKEVVYEAGIANLTKDETPALTHFGGGNTQQFVLVRLKRPEAKPDAAAAGAATSSQAPGATSPRSPAGGRTVPPPPEPKRRVAPPPAEPKRRSPPPLPEPTLSPTIPVDGVRTAP